MTNKHDGGWEEFAERPRKDTVAEKLHDVMSAAATGYLSEETGKIPSFLYGSLSYGPEDDRCMILTFGNWSTKTKVEVYESIDPCESFLEGNENKEVAYRVVISDLFGAGIKNEGELVYQSESSSAILQAIMIEVYKSGDPSLFMLFADSNEEDDEPVVIENFSVDEEDGAAYLKMIELLIVDNLGLKDWLEDFRNLKTQEFASLTEEFISEDFENGILNIRNDKPEQD